MLWLPSFITSAANTALLNVTGHSRQEFPEQELGFKICLAPPVGTLHTVFSNLTSTEI